jgi:hypothetical protein
MRVRNPGSARMSQNAWANVSYRLSENFAFGFEYSYGQFETIDARDGENHRFLFVVSLSTSEETAEGVTRATGVADESLFDLSAPRPPGSGESDYPRLKGTLRWLRERDPVRPLPECSKEAEQLPPPPADSRAARNREGGPTVHSLDSIRRRAEASGGR